MTSPRSSRCGFTLLEALVATAIMAAAVSTLLAALSASTRNASRVSEHDRATLLAKRTIDNLLLDPTLPHDTDLEGHWAAQEGLQGGWRARLHLFEAPPNLRPGMQVLERLVFQVWWRSGNQTRTLDFEAFRRVSWSPQ
jgi:type II secretion system protein I